MIEHWLADAVRAIHLLFVLFLLGGLLVIPAGMVMRAAWVRHPWFRWPHLAASMFMVVRIWTGASCPLSDLEYAIRGERLVRPMNLLLFRDMERSQFSAGVIAQGIMSGLFLFVCPPRRCVRDRRRPENLFFMGVFDGPDFRDRPHRRDQEIQPAQQGRRGEVRRWPGLPGDRKYLRRQRF